MLGTPAPGAASADPVALGEAVFKRTPPACFGCHSLQQGVTSSARRWPAWRRARTRCSEVPTTRAQRKRRRSTSANRSSTRMRYLVPGQTFSAGGQSIMPPLAYDSEARGDRPARRLPRDVQVRGAVRMRYRTQAVAYPYFVVALLLYGLQMAFGLLSAAKYLGPDPIKDWLPFDVTKAIHTNLLIVWVLTGFMGAAYWLVPEESRTELHSPKMAYWQLGLWTLAGRHGRRRLPVRLDGRQQAAGAAAAGQARDRRRDADVSLQPRHDHLEGQAPHDHRRRADGGPGHDRHPVPAGAASSSTTTRSPSSTAGGRFTCGSKASGR